MFYKKQKLNGKWYPRSVTMGTVDTEHVARRLSLMASVTKSDTYAVLVGLGEVLGELMQSGRTVKLKGLGTFYLVGNACKRGADTADEVSPKQFRGVRVRFIPEFHRGSNRKISQRTIVPEDIEWLELPGSGPADGDGQ